MSITKCSVPNCNSNSGNGGPKVATFAIPTDPELLQKWCEVIDDFNPSPPSRICALHFRDADIEKITKLCKTKSGKTISVLLKPPTLTKDAVPSKLLKLSENTETNKSNTDTLPSKPLRVREHKDQILNTIKGVYKNFNKSKYLLGVWRISKTKQTVCFTHIKKSGRSRPVCLLSVDSSMSVSMVYENNPRLNIEVNGNTIKFPFQFTTVGDLEKILADVSEFITNQPDRNIIAEDHSYFRDHISKLEATLLIPKEELTKETQDDSETNSEEILYDISYINQLKKTTEDEDEANNSNSSENTEELESKLNSLWKKYQALKEESNTLAKQIRRVEQINNALKFIALNNSNSDQDDYDSENKQDLSD